MPCIKLSSGKTVCFGEDTNKYPDGGPVNKDKPIINKGVDINAKPFMKDNDSWFENIVEIVDPTGISSWDDVKRAGNNYGYNSPEFYIEAAGAVPFLGKIGKSGKIITGGFGLLQNVVKGSKYLPSGAQKKVLDKAYDLYQTYSKSGGKELDDALGVGSKFIRDNISLLNPSLHASSTPVINSFNTLQKVARGKTAYDAATGSKDNSGFKGGFGSSEPLQYDGRNVLPDLSSEYNYSQGGTIFFNHQPVHFPDGGRTDDAAFKKFVSTLPSNLKNTGSDYNLRGYWETLGKPSAFNYSQKKESDGKYHGFSRNDKTGEILKRPNHPSFGQAIEKDRKIGYYPYQSPSGVIHTFKPNEVPPGFKPIYVETRPYYNFPVSKEQQLFEQARYQGDISTQNNIKQFDPGGRTLQVQGSGFNFPISKEQQLAQQSRMQGDMPVAPAVVKAQERMREQEAVKKKLVNQPTVKLSDAQKKDIDVQGLKQDVLAEMMSRNQHSLANPDDRSIETDIAQDLNENGAMGLLDAPVKGATALLTGRYQTPSQAIGRWANQNNHQMLRNAMIDDQFNPTGLGMVTDFGGEFALGKAIQKAPGLLNKINSRVDNVDNLDYMSLEAPKGNMYGENQVLVQQSRLLNPEIKKKFFKNHSSISRKDYDNFINNVHGSTEYDLAETVGRQPSNLGLGNFGKTGMVYKDATFKNTPLNNLGKDIINAHEKNHGVFAGTLSSKMKNDLLKPFGTNTPLSYYDPAVQGDEVLARMGQFKNAVGIGDNQTFTLGHLNLIRKNYANQFIDNNITDMLSKIPPGSSNEREFLKNMNKYAFGIGAGTVVGTSQLDQKNDGGKNTKTINNTNMPCIKLSTGKTVCYGDQQSAPSFDPGGETTDKNKSLPVYNLPGVDVRVQPDQIKGGYNYETCVEGACKGEASQNNLSTLEFRKMNNLFGNVKNISNNAFADPADLNNLHTNDFVIMKKDRLLFPDKRSGYVTGFDTDNTPLIRYYDKKQKRYFTERLPNLGKGVGNQYVLSDAFTPDEFRPVSYNTQKLKLDPNYSANDIEKGVVETSQKDAREVQDVLNLTDKEFDQLNRLAFGVIGAESQFGRSGRTLYRMATPRGLQVAVKKVKDLFGGIPYDENLNSLSEGYSSTKKSGQYNYGVINPKIKKTQAEINKDIREGKFDNYDKNTNFIYHAFNQLGIDPENLDNAGDSYKAAMAQLAFYKQLNPNATDEELLKRYTGKRNIKEYKKMVDEHLSKIDGNSSNNPQYGAMDEFLGNASIAANNIGRGQREVKSKIIGAIRDNIPFVPANITSVLADALGSKTPITNKTFSESNINALKNIARQNILKGKNSIEYGDYKTTNNNNAESDVGSGSVSLSKGLTDDAYILKTTLGQAGIKDLGNGDYEITDTYDFNDQGRTFGLMDDLHKRKFGLYNLARTVGRNYGSRDGSGAPVSIKLHFTPEELKRTPLPTPLATFDKRSPNIEELTAPNMRGVYTIPSDPRQVPVVEKPTNKPTTPPSKTPTKVITAPVTEQDNYLGLVDTMKMFGYNDTSKDFRKQLAKELGVNNYDFSANKNKELKDKLLALEARKTLQSESYAFGGQLLNNNSKNMPCIKLSSGKTVCYGEQPSYDEGGKTYVVKPSSFTMDPRYARGYSVSGGELPNQMAARNNAARTAVVVPKRNDVSAFIPNDVPEGEGRMGVGYQPTISELLNLTANDLRDFRDRGLDYIDDNILSYLYDDGNQGMGRNIQERDKQQALENWYNDRVQEGALYDPGDEGMGRTNYLKDKYGTYALGGETGDGNKKNKGYKYDANGNITHIDVTSVFKDDLDNGKLTDKALNKMRDLQSGQDKIIHFCYSNAGCAQIANMAANAYRGNDWIPNNEFNKGHAWTIGLSNDMEDFFYPYTEDLIRGNKKDGFPNSVVKEAFNPNTLKKNVKNLKNYSDRMILLDRKDVEPNDPKSASAQARTGTGNEHVSYMLPDGKFLIHGTSFHNKKDQMKSHFNRNGFFIMDNIQDGRIQGMGLGDYAPVGTVNDD